MPPPPDPPLRIGTLGAARITGSALLKPAGDVDGVEVAAVAARDRARAERFAARAGIPRVHDDYEALLADPEIDAVYNPLPNGLHGRYTTAALEAGKHVLCEKPFAANATEARKVAAVAEGSDRVVMEAFHYRYHPLMEAAIEVTRHEIGPLRHVESWMQIPLLRPGDIRYDFDLAGGATMDVGCYSIHQLRSLVGREPIVRSARARRHRGGQIDRHLTAELDFGEGVTGRFTCSLYGLVPLRIGFRAVGEEGELRVLNPAGPQIFHRFVVRTPRGRVRRRFPRVATYRYQLEAFAAAVRDGAPVPTDPADAVANLVVIDDAYRAAGLEVRPVTP